MKRYLAIVTALVVAAGSLLAAAPTHAQKSDIVIGIQCDRTGATQIVGTVLCPGLHDYVALVNRKGGVEGHKIKAIEIDHEYKVPPGVESYERHKKEGAVSIAVYGTPHIYALAAAPPPPMASAIPTFSPSPRRTGRRRRPRWTSRRSSSAAA